MMIKTKGSDDRQLATGHSLCRCPDTRFTIMNGLNQNRPLRTGPRLFFIMVFMWTCLATPILAAEWRVVPKLGVSGGYDDNIFYTKEDKVDSSVVSIEPGVELDYQSLLSSLLLKADFDILSYLDESDLNRVNQYYRLEGNHRLGQRWDARTELRFYNDTTLNTYLEETGRVVERIDREYGFAKGGISYDISTISSIDTDYIYETARYSDDAFSDYDKHRISLRYRHRLKTQQDVLLIGPSYYKRKNDLNDTDYVSLDLGWIRDWSDITNTYASIGARYTNVKDKDGNDENNWGALARFNLTRKGIVSTTTFEYYHDLATLVDGTDVNVDNFHLRYDYLLTERFGLGINGRLVLSYDLFSSQGGVEDNRYYMVEPFLFYRLTEDFKVYLRYTYQNSSKDLVESEDTLERNRAWIEFRYELPMLL
ncbi:hypothetical protein [uncultured Desulfosarcina sp.]|uniref:hypothetical protein n=1 Tax=uncultured Desulfosarcina sp. TaxID=218289 RepID=UPI0029C715D4|nr:hypothetical protein [uncultured Desulfosarcina sp.]